MYFTHFFFTYTLGPVTNILTECSLISEYLFAIGLCSLFEHCIVSLLFAVGRDAMASKSSRHKEAKDAEVLTREEFD